MQGFNMGRYYPPDSDSRTPQFNTSAAQHRSKGVPIVRFELPFAVWCQKCKPEAIIGQGVRFNAEKRRVGNYHSTPIWAFRMKHTACGGWWEIRTDPRNAAYVVVEGARRREYGAEGGNEEEEGELRFLTEEERERRRGDAFARFEGKKEDKGLEERGRDRVQELVVAQEVWRDPYTMNQKLRRVFRGERKVLEREAGVREGLQEKYGLGLEIAEEVESDAARAGLVDFGDKGAADAVVRRGLFETREQEKGKGAVPQKGKLKREIVLEERRKEIRKRLVGNTKAAIDPFLSNLKTSMKTTFRITKLKRTEK
ncbi:uncharacterized protein EI97DRAFT_342594, partial [Westerdykella ornata]